MPVKRKIRRNVVVVGGEKPAVAQKPAHLKLRARIVKCRGPRVVVPGKGDGEGRGERVREDDVSAGQSQVGWVKKMVGQLQAQVDA